ncbi:benenodin family lasso peptide [Luteimonas sp. RIT-PG2_3]
MKIRNHRSYAAIAMESPWRNQQEKDMNVRNDNTARPEVQDDIIELGVASVDTHGPGLRGEDDGAPIFPGISEE